MSDGVTGLAALRTQKPDCVLLDFNLPDMTGLEFLVDAAGAGELPCAIVLVAGQGSEAIAVEAMKLGIQDYLVKDQITASSLRRSVTTAVTQTELRKNLARSMRELTAMNAALEQEVAIRKAAEAELREAKESAEQADRAKTRFVAMVTHELRTPLNGILGYAQLLRIEGGLSTHQNARVGAMMLAGQHLLEMIERVLDFASIEAGRMELHPVPVAVRDLCERCIAFIGPMAAECALSLRLISLHDTPRQIIADPARLRQVLLNLLGNAVKYTRVGGVELRILPGATIGGLRIEVADSGPGIDESSCGRLFQDFERLGATTSVEGAGMGLAIAARIIGLMNGTIGYLPNPGGGSVFWLELPPIATFALPSPEDQVPSPMDAASAGPPLSGRRVLLVDDIAMNRDVISGFLCAAGHTAVVAESGREAVRLASEQTFDLILMDVRMPEMDGLEATRRIRTLPAPRGQVPIVALTAYAFPEQIAQTREAGMDGHVTKPVDYATLLGAITTATSCPAQRRTESSLVASAVEVVGDDRSPVRFDRGLFDQTLGFLEPDDVAANLGQLRARSEQMLQLLQRPTESALLVEAAHTLASAVGMFGFIAQSMVARSFERAVANGSPELDRLAEQVQTGTSCSNRGARCAGERKPNANHMTLRIIANGVILAENDAQVRGIVRSVLVRADQQVFPAADGLEALDLARQFKARLVLLDIGMPRFNGLQACEAIRALPDYADVPIVMLTGYDEERVRLAAIRAGAHDFITKPFRPDLLLARLAKYLHLPAGPARWRTAVTMRRAAACSGGLVLTVSTRQRTAVRKTGQGAISRGRRCGKSIRKLSQCLAIVRN